MSKPAVGQVARLTIPIIAGANSPKRGLKSADGSVCLYMDENKLTLFDDERGMVVAQVECKLITQVYNKICCLLFSAVTSNKITTLFSHRLPTQIR